MNLNDKLNQAAADVAEWNAKIFKLREDITKAEAVLAESQHRRQSHVLEAALGSDDAKDRLAQVLADDRRAERELEDLRSALPLAQSQLREAEAAHRAAEDELRRAEVTRLAIERVSAAADIDRSLADFSAAWARYEDLGHQLYNAASDHQNQIYLSETCDGMARLSAALPLKPFYDLRHRHSFAPIGTSKSSLAAAEAAYWRLPVDEAKAA
jgi:chromosome segregation ATPase